MKKSKSILATVVVVALTALLFTACEKPTTLGEAYKGKFYVGTAMNAWQITGKDTASLKVIKEQFSAIVAENCMKSGPIHPREDEYNFDLADQFVDFGVQNNKFITGHCLIWHSQAPRWFFRDSTGEIVSAEVLKQRMKDHIFTVVGRYKGKVKGWDVVNEAINDDGSYRNSMFYRILGEDFIKYAFQFAHEADPECELYYNDYSMDKEGKRNGVVAMVKKLQEEGIRIDGIGMQSHVALDYPDLKEYEASMEAFGDLGVKVMVTELDISVLPTPQWGRSADISNKVDYQAKYNPYTEGLPDSARVALENRYLDFFKLYLKHQNYVSRVTLWGVNDAGSWKNNFPVRGRTDYPLLFDRSNQPKSVVPLLIDLANND